MFFVWNIFHYPPVGDQSFYAYFCAINKSMSYCNGQNNLSLMWVSWNLSQLKLFNLSHFKLLWTGAQRFIISQYSYIKSIFIVTHGLSKSTSFDISFIVLLTILFCCFIYHLILASRAKLAAVIKISNIRGQAKSALYPQPEGNLGECMIKYGGDLGQESLFGNIYP